MKTFYENAESIEAFNSRQNESYKRSLSDHSDLSLEEKRTYRLGLNMNYVSARAQGTIPMSILMQNSTRSFGTLLTY